MKGSKMRGRLAARQGAYKDIQGFKRPGSFKKPFPHGRGKSHA